MYTFEIPKSQIQNKATKTMFTLTLDLQYSNYAITEISLTSVSQTHFFEPNYLFMLYLPQYLHHHHHHHPLLPPLLLPPRLSSDV